MNNIRNIRRVYSTFVGLHHTLHHTTLHYTTLHYTTLHYTTLHYTTLHYTTLHYTTRTTLHYTTLHYTTLHYTTLHYTTLHYTTLHYTTLHYTTLHYTTLHYTTLHYTTLHYTTLHYTTLHYTTLHYTTLHCTALHYTTLHYTTLHYTRITLAHNIIAAEFSAICFVCRGFLLCLLSFHNQVGQVQRLNKLIKCVTCSHIKTDKKNCPAITKHVLLCNIVLQLYSFFVLLKKSKSDALHIRIFFTIFELRPRKLLSCVSPVLQNALLGIN